MKRLYQRLILLLRGLSIRLRLTLLILTLILLSLLATVVCYFSARQSMIASSADNLENVLVQTGKNIDSELSRVILELSSIVNDFTVMHDTRDYDGSSFQRQMEIRTQFRNTLNSVSLTNRSYAGGEIWSQTQKIAGVMSNISGGTLESSAFLQQAINAERAFQFLGCAPLESSTADQKLHYLIFSSKILSGSNYYAPAGCALFAFSESSFYRSVFSSMQNDKEIYLATTSGQILSHSDKQLLAAQQPQPLTDWVRAELDAGQSHGSRTFRLDGEEKLVVFDKLSYGDWVVYHLVDYRMLIREADRSFFDFYLILAVFAILMSVILIPVTQSITGPLRCLNDAMQKDDGSGKDVLPVDGHDEISVLIQTFNQQQLRIQTLLDETKRAAEEKLTAQFQALQSQINPHFLYNTLDTVNWMAFLSDQTEICQIMGSLSDFFRLSLNNGQDFYHVSDELAHVDSYITIQKFRFSGKIRYQKQIAPETLSLYTLKTLIQPLVENAIQHGLQHGGIAGTVTIRTYIEDQYLIYEVEDDGAGLHTAQPDGTRPHSGGYGIRNIDSRIKLYFGDSCGLRLFERQPHGVLARITLPCMHRIPEKGGADHENTGD